MAVGFAGSARHRGPGGGMQSGGQNPNPEAIAHCQSNSHAYPNTYTYPDADSYPCFNSYPGSGPKL
ncbi:MAG: hypothetical protein KJ624_02530 [Chloroflexi bacterium]|nr:hypothetical protein [Chloroflexota bacterium]